MIRAALVTVAVAVVAFAGYKFLESPGNQIFGKTIVSGPANEKIVALTYDDGPNPPYTNAILDVLKREQVHATFFLVGRAVAAYPQTVRDEVSDGNAIGNHTWDHAHLIVLGTGSIRSSLERTDDAIFRATGERPHIMRPPFGARDWLVLDEVRRLGYTPVMWSVPLANDWEDPPSQVIAGRILRYVRDGSIIVLHDGNRGIICSGGVAQRTCDRSSDIEATRIIVESLKKQGFRFVTIPQLIALRGSGSQITHTSLHPNE
jgi:peptidoglycan/xylan/chitin deacetylase (PgdA/CDA1 family)